MVVAGTSRSHTFCISSCSWVMRSIWVNSCSISLQSGRFWESLMQDPLKGGCETTPRSEFAAYGSCPSLILTATMGNDGGSIPDRRDLVRTKPKVRDRFNFPSRSLTTGLRLNEPTRRIRLVPGGSSARSLRSVLYFVISSTLGLIPHSEYCRNP